jgi:hypothetical protein
MENPTPADALAITKALRTHGGMEGRRLAEQIEELCCAADETAIPRAAGRPGAEADAKALSEAGLKLSWGKIQSGKRSGPDHAALNGSPTEPFDSSRPNAMSFSVMCSTRWTSPRIKHPLPPTGANRATSLIW